MAATAIAIATTASSSSASLSLSNKISNFFWPDHFCITPIPTTHFTFRAKPIKILKLNATRYPNFSPFSLFSGSLVLCTSAAFDSVGSTQDAEPAEAKTETQVEIEKKEEKEEEEEEDVAVVSHSAEARRLFVGNLPYAMTSVQLAEVFNEAGRVVSVEIVYDRVTDRSRGFAFVTMGSVEEAKEALRMFDGSQLGGRTVKVNFPEVPRGGERAVMGPKIRSSYQGFVDSPHKIYAGNLSWVLTSQGLREAFEDQPGLLSAKVIYDRNSGRSRGFGFITFASAEDVESAVNAMNGVEVEGRPLRLNLAEERAPTAPPTTETDIENNMESSDMLSSINS